MLTSMAILVYALDLSLEMDLSAYKMAPIVLSWPLLHQEGPTKREDPESFIDTIYHHFASKSAIIDHFIP